LASGGSECHVAGHETRHVCQVGVVATELAAQVDQRLRAWGQADVQHQGIQTRVGQVTFGFLHRDGYGHGGSQSMMNRDLLNRPVVTDS